ncbi:uncharacterized protein LOC117318296 [Pecten maximus]|uniref:uncharacterized protein LOC117318296 n=1 Tax=Pecten maximus TaxID=6579 RepID=UPI001458A842|nr:uncharacterized protein LOC117318296 [Pecten maximus]
MGLSSILVVFWLGMVFAEATVPFPWGCKPQRQQMVCPRRVNAIPDVAFDPEIKRIIFQHVVEFNLTYAGHLEYLEIRKTPLGCDSFSSWPIRVFVNRETCNNVTESTTSSTNQSTTAPRSTPSRIPSPSCDNVALDDGRIIFDRWSSSELRFPPIARNVAKQ